MDANSHMDPMPPDEFASQLTARGIGAEMAAKVAGWIDEGHARNTQRESWARLCSDFLTPAHDFSLHLAVYHQCNATSALNHVDHPAWLPTSDIIANANVTALAGELGLPDYPALHRWSAENREEYWRRAIERLGIRLRQAYTKVVDAEEPTRPRWLVGATMNIVDSCFQADPGAPAVIESVNGNLKRWTYDELRRLTARVANGLTASGIVPGNAVGLVMPMTARAVAIYLGVVAAGAVAVSIADSFAPEEIALRFRLAGVKLVFTQDAVLWGKKKLPLYEKIVAAGAPATIVLTVVEQTPVALRSGDIRFESFLANDQTLNAVACDPQAAINILFSSGTTGEPKAIPWDHTTPIKCGADAHFHQDLHPGDVACWPTNLGWMMGPWLIFATHLNRATMALYPQAPTDASFGRFVQDAGVTMLGLVPSLVRAWRQSGCMRALDWSRIRAFSSTGECSNPVDMLYLMHLAGYCPIIEYCGGTEIGGAYVTGTVVEPCIPSTFTTPALGMDFVLLDESGDAADKAEVFIDGISLGLSTRLINRDNDAVYFADTPIGRAGMPLRRHGDELETLRNGYFRVAGRCDDTMNLGGIKVGCSEIERVLNQVPGVLETAAVAVPPAGGGPSRLVIFAVPRAGGSETAESLKAPLQQAIRTQLNPLFHVDEVRLVTSLPRTASNKVMRRELRALCLQR